MSGLENVEDAVKVIVVGNGGVGKSSIVRRYCKGDFTTEYKKTIGTDFLEKDAFIKSLNDTVKMMLWDTAGQEVFGALTSQYYRGAGACVLAFSTTDRDSFLAIKSWKDKVEAVCGKDSIVIALIQTKIDLMDQALVQTHEAESLAKQLGVKFFRTSCKENFMVDNVFEYLAESYLNRGSSALDSMPIQQGAKGVRKDDPVPAVKAFGSEQLSPKAKAEATSSSPQSQSQASTIRIGAEPSTRRAKSKKPWANCQIL